MLRVRKAEMSDVESTYQWRNDVRVRRHCLNTEPFEFESHKDWYQSSLSNPDVVTYIVQDVDEPVGVVRFTIEGLAATIDIYIDPNQHGKGYGFKGLRKAISQFKSQHSDNVSTLLATVVVGNTVSEKLFEKSGFTKTSTNYKLDLKGWKDI